MNEKTLKALRESILRWDSISKTKDGARVDIGAKDCPLCLLHSSVANHLVEMDECCEGCPVYWKTERKHCRETPYSVFSNEWHKRRGDMGPELRELAGEELEFLRSLLPKEGQS